MRFLFIFLCSILSLEIFAQELQGIKLEVKENNSSRKKTFGKNLLNKMRGIDGEKE